MSDTVLSLAIRSSVDTADSFIHVDRAATVKMPNHWQVKELLHPELEHTGLADYDAATIKLWLHDEQRQRLWKTNGDTYAHLKSNNLLDSCLGYADGMSIKQKGRAFYRKHFGENRMFLWRSVFLSNNNFLHIPYMECHIGEVRLRTEFLGLDWYDPYPAARFAS